MRFPLLAVLLVFLAPEVRAQAVTFDEFLVDAEKCGQSAAFADFHKDIGAKYRNDFGVRGAHVDDKVVVRIPPDLATGFGQARSVNKGEYTQVIVPALGIWRGLALREFEFTLGNENGIAAWAFRFAARHADVERVFGAEVAAAARAFRASRGDGAPMSVSIPRGKGEIVCDASD